MIFPDQAVRIVVATKPVDFRKGHDGFITSSPKWLITFTAIRPDLGLAKGREVSE